MSGTYSKPPRTAAMQHTASPLTAARAAHTPYRDFSLAVASFPFYISTWIKPLCKHSIMVYDGITALKAKPAFSLSAHYARQTDSVSCKSSMHGSAPPRPCRATPLSHYERTLGVKTLLRHTGILLNKLRKLPALSAPVLQPPLRGALTPPTAALPSSP